MKLSLKWRLTAIAALLSLAGISALVIRTVLAKPVLLVFVAGVIILMLYSGWLIFTGTSKRLLGGWLLLIGCLATIVVGLVIFLSHDNNLRPLILTAGLVAIYGLLITELHQQYWTQKRQSAQKQRKTAAFKHPVLIINPKSGDGRAIKASVDKQARALGIKVIITKKGDSIEGLAQMEVDRGADVLGVSGGDGTLGAVAKVALSSDLPLVVLPGGTRCHFARDAGFEPERINDALASFRGVESKVDVGVINDRIFLNNASFGLYADIVDNPDYRKHKVATSRRVLQDILSGARSAYNLQFRDQAGKQHSQAVQILVGVNPYESLNLFELGHRKSLNSGKLQVTIVTRLDDATIRQLMSTIAFTKFFAGTTKPDNFFQWETTKFRVDGKQTKLVVGVDGEREEYKTPIKISLHPTKLRLMVPAEGRRPRSTTPLDMVTIKRLWRAVLGKSI